MDNGINDLLMKVLNACDVATRAWRLKQLVEHEKFGGRSEGIVVLCLAFHMMERAGMVVVVSCLR
jgi:hypothetical protein